MNAQELFRAGRLREAVEAQTAELKARPLDPDARFFLFALLCFSGELERAETHLVVIAQRDESMRAGALLYRSLLGSELERRKVFREGASPTLPPDPPASLALRREALAHSVRGDREAAERALEQAADASALCSGKLDGEAFDALRDCDDLLGEVLEVFAGGRYLWLPFQNVRRLELGAPKTHIDLLWAPAELEDSDGRQVRVYLPALYEGSQQAADDAVRIGRATEWAEQPGLGHRGAGQHLLLTVRGEEERETPLLDARRIEIDASGGTPS
jgi:type VI secretion system protein ImpE